MIEKTITSSSTQQKSKSCWNRSWNKDKETTTTPIFFVPQKSPQWIDTLSTQRPTAHPFAFAHLLLHALESRHPNENQQLKLRVLVATRRIARSIEDFENFPNGTPSNWSAGWRWRGGEPGRAHKHRRPQFWSHEFVQWCPTSKYTTIGSELLLQFFVAT